MRLKKISRSILSAAAGRAKPASPTGRSTKKMVEAAESYPHARPPRPLRFGGFAAFWLCRGHPSSWRRGMLRDTQSFGNGENCFHRWRGCTVCIDY